MGLEAETNAAEFFISRLKSQIAKLNLRPHPGDLQGPGDWLKLCEALVETALQYLKTASAQKLAEADRIGLLKETNRLCNNVYKLLVEMEGAGTDALPYAIVAPMQRWIDQLGIKNVTFFRSLAIANYELHRFSRDFYDGIRNPSLNLQQILDKRDNWPYLRITVPGKALSILPHFAIVAHEIGHILYDQKTPSFPFRKAEQDKYEKIVLRGTKKKRLKPKVKIFLNETTRFWATELFADAIGICLLGPAFFFALCAFLESVGQGHILSKTHPSAIIRRKIAFKKLDRSPRYSFRRSFKKITKIDLTEKMNSSLLDDTRKKPSSLMRTLRGNFTDDEAVILAFLPDIIETIADDVYKKAEDIIRSIQPDLLYTSAQLEADLSEHLENLINAVPPIESGLNVSKKVPTELATILNVGWAALLTRIERLAVRKEGYELLSAERSEKLHSLLIKAVELSEARRTWMNN